MTFMTWDPANCDVWDARVTDACSPMDAAEAHGRADDDGRTDGLYQDEGTDIRVRDADGNECTYRVAWVDHPPEWHERLAATAELRAVALVIDV